MDGRLATVENLGFLLAKASQRWNEALYEEFVREGFAEVRPAYGSILLPLFEEDSLRMGELGARARLSKQTMTTLVRLMERNGLVARERDPADGRAFRVRLTARARAFEPVAERVLVRLEERVATRLSSTDRTILTHSLKEVLSL
ncbi:MAG: MarR family winged helix-turn-helix transcriptional regulator [Gaiellaceae bacterium]